MMESERETERERQTDRQTHTHTHTERERERERDREGAARRGILAAPGPVPQARTGPQAEDSGVADLEVALGDLAA